MNGKSYYIGQVAMEDTSAGLMEIEEIQVFGKKAVKIYGIFFIMRNFHPSIPETDFEGARNFV